MERREFLQQISTAIALALTPALGTGCATLHGPDLRHLDHVASDDGDALVALLSERLEKIRDSANLPRVRAWIADRGLSEDFAGNLFGALWSAATFRDLSARSRALPQVQRWLMSEVPRIAGAVFETAELLDGLDRTERDELAKLLADEPEVLETAFTGFSGHADRRGVEHERVRQIRAVTDHHVWRIRHQSVDAVFDDYTSRLDRLCKRHGVARTDWRAGLAAELVAWGALDIATESNRDLAEDSAVVDDDTAALRDPFEAITHDGAHLGLFLEEASDGPVVRHVTRGSPAERAGLREGDRLAAVDGASWDAAGLVAWLGLQKSGRAVLVDVRRDGGPATVEVALGAGPGDRLVSGDRIGGTARFPFLTAGAQSVGVNIILVGVGVFAAGAVIALLGIGAQSGGLAGFGAVLTVLGLAAVIVGLIVLIIEVIIKSSKRDPGPLPEPQSAMATP